jgi:GNAT superfamily N-acetyltransferase
MNDGAGAAQENMDGVKIRRAKLGDGSAIEQLYRQLHEGDYISPGAAKMQRALRALLRKRDETLLVAAKDGRIVGSTHVLIFRHLGRALRPVAIVENVIVDANFRRAGIGEQLMAAAIQIARRQNCYKLSLTTNRKRKPAHRFYERIGWNRTHFGYTFSLAKR